MSNVLTNSDFVMHGARSAISGGMLHIQEQVKAIELAVEENPGLTFDLAKTLVESTCRTILTERSIGFEPGDDLVKLFKAATNNLPFLPTSAIDAPHIRKSLAQTLSGLHTAVQGICELRNACGFASHGSDGPRPALENVQALLAAGTADAIVGFLHRTHLQDRLPPRNPHQAYEDNSDFNDYVDEVHDAVTIFETEFRPSEVLYRVDPEAYRIYLTEFEPEIEPATPEE